MDLKLLTEAGWKLILQKYKLKDNGLQRGLWAYEKIEEKKYEERIKALAAIVGFAGNLRRSKDVAAVPEAAKHLANLVNTAEVMRKEIAGLKEVAEKQAEVADKKEQMERQEAEQEEEEENDPDAEANYRQVAKQLAAGLQHVQSAGAKGSQWVATVPSKSDETARAPSIGLLIADTIGPQHKQLLTKATGSKRFMGGKCSMKQGKLLLGVEEGAMVIGPKTVTALRRAIQYFTGKNIVVGAWVEGDEVMESEESNPETDVPDLPEDAAEDADKPEKAAKAEAKDKADAGAQTPSPAAATSAEPAASPAAAEAAAPAAAPAAGRLALSGSVGHRGKNKLEDVQAVQGVLNQRAGASLQVDGKCGAKTIGAIVAFQRKLGLPVPDGLVEPGKITEKALNGEPVKVPEAHKAAKPAGGGKPGAAAKGAGTAQVGGVFGVSGTAIAAMMKEIADRQAKAKKLADQVTAKMNELAKLGGAQSLDPAQQKAFQDAVQANTAHHQSFMDFLKQAAQQQEAVNEAKFQQMKAGAIQLFEDLKASAKGMLGIKD